MLHQNILPLSMFQKYSKKQHSNPLVSPAQARLTRLSARTSTTSKSDGGETRVDDREQAERMAQLEARISALKAPTEQKPHTEEHYSQAQHAWRMVIELVAGLLIGFGIGYGLDAVFGTLPIFLVLFTLLGFAAGIKTMMRSAEELQRKEAAFEAEKDAARSGAGEGTRDGD